MRKLKLQVQVSVDGLIAGPNGEMDWMIYNWSDDIKKDVDNITTPVDTILLGKNLAVGFIPHWAAVAQDNNDPDQEAGITYSQTPKIVFSKTLTTSEWENTEIENGDFVEKIDALKKQDGKDLIVYGGGKFVSSLIKGMPIFQDVDAMQKLKLVSSKHFDCGIIVLVYKPM
jgi:dihydrofolate reductase